MRYPVLLAFFLCLLQQLTAQSGNWDRYVELKSCHISVEANLFSAKTFLEMEFFNSGNQETERLYKFKLMPHQVITGFQLELNGRYRDGSIEENW